MTGWYYQGEWFQQGREREILVGPEKRHHNPKICYRPVMLHGLICRFDSRV